jgi:hypothetical protein
VTDETVILAINAAIMGDLYAFEIDEIVKRAINTMIHCKFICFWLRRKAPLYG